MTTVLCLVMVGSGVRQAEAAGTQTKQNRQIWVSASEDASESIPSADGRYVAFTDWNTGDLGIRDLKVGKSRRLTSNQDWETSGYYDYAESPAVSPDNRQIVYTWGVDKERRAELRVSSVKGGDARTLQRSATGDYYKVFGWTPDGKQVLVVRRLGQCQVALVSLQDGSTRVVKSFARRDLSLNASLSPDGRYVAYDFPQNENTGARDIFVIPTDGSRDASELQHPANDWAPKWSADGTRILFLSDRTGDPSLWSVGVESGRPNGDSELIRTGMERTVLLGVTRTGILQYVIPGSSSPNIYRADLGAGLKASTRPVKAVERFINSNLGPQLSPDGKQLAYVSLRTGGAVIVIRDLDTNDEREVRPRSLTVVRGYGPMWFPDRQSLLIVARDSRGPGFYKVDLRSGNEEVLQRFSGFIDGYSLSPNGKSIFYIDRSPEPVALRFVRFDLDTKKETELKKGDWFTSIAVSPDSRELAYRISDPTVSRLMVMPAEGGEAREVFRNSNWDGSERFNGLAWTPDQKFLIFVRAGSASTSPHTLWKVPASGGKPEELGISFIGNMGSPQVLPDGKKIFFAANETSPNEMWTLENFFPRPVTKGR